MKTTAIAAIIVAAIVVAGAAVYVITKDNGDADSKQTICVTMAWEGYLVEEIAGDEYNVNALVGANVSPHEVNITVSQINELYTSDVYFEIGSGVEWEVAFLEEAESEIPDTLDIVVLADEISYTALPSPESGEGDAKDPHIWTSPDNLYKMAEVIAEKLSELNPDNADKYADNLASFKSEADAVGDAIEELAELVGDETFTVVVWHPAWQYFLEQYAAAYGLNLDMYAIEADGEVEVKDAVAMVLGEGNTIYVSITDEGYEGKATLEESGITVYVVNPTTDDMLSELNKFVSYLKEDLTERA